ncbi:hypothetical protein BJ684DRAFT_16214 [Piptocephalis cylindrospora]|uniref:Uncharacterized protein n=1 Tax=Piptocephalis cylindrospora TaxID=1907219 RepID=A0A4P9Y372_9FUNG|nr:hypothetical protein BJ684DRAFT_16214 [Piptocephalis cylindrospora]|eukprot:RKP13376.1 hypothetical protein BJ684DRAFT_16214 [Piptocephalis cylindrospora]
MASSTETSPSSSSSSLLAQFQKNPEDLTPVRPKAEDYGPLPSQCSTQAPSLPLALSASENEPGPPQDLIKGEGSELEETPPSGNSPVTPAEGPALSFMDSFPSIFESLDTHSNMSSSYTAESAHSGPLGLSTLTAPSIEEETGNSKAFGIHHSSEINGPFMSSGLQGPFEPSSFSSSISQNPPPLVSVSGSSEDGISASSSPRVHGYNRTLGLHSPPDSRRAHPIRSILKVSMPSSGSKGGSGGFFGLSPSSPSSSGFSSSTSARPGQNHGMAQPTARVSSPTASLWKPREWFSLANRATSPSSSTSSGGKGSLLSPLLRRSSSLRSSLSGIGGLNGRGTPPYSSSSTSGQPSPPSSPRPSFTSIDSREETVPSPTPSSSSLQSSSASSSLKALSRSEGSSAIPSTLISSPSKVLKRVRFPVKYMVQEYVFSPDAADRDDSTGFTLILEPSSSRMSPGSRGFHGPGEGEGHGPTAHRGAPSLNPDVGTGGVCTAEEVINYYQEACRAREESPSLGILRQLTKATVRKGLRASKGDEAGGGKVRRRRRRRRRREGQVVEEEERQEADDLEDMNAKEREEAKEDQSIYLDTLDLNGIALDRHTSDILSDLLGLPCDLRRLEVGECDLTNESLKVLLHSLLLVDQVEELSLPRNGRLGTEGFKYVAIYVKKSRVLRLLDVSSTCPDRKAVKYLSHALMANEGSLQSLSLDVCGLGPTLLEPLVPAIRRSSLRSLSLVGNNMGIMGAAWMGALLRQRKIIKEKAMETPNEGDLEGDPEGVVTWENPKLETLDVSENGIKSVGVIHLTRALQENGQLRELRLAGNQLDPSSLVAIGECLRLNQTLQLLDLSGNPIFDGAIEGISHLRRGLEGNQSLKYLHLSETELDDEGAIGLAEFLPEARALHRLDLSLNPQVKLAGIMALTVSLRMNYHLTCLDVDVPPDDPEMAEYSREILRLCVRNFERGIVGSDHEYDSLLRGQLTGLSRRSSTASTSSLIKVLSLNSSGEGGEKEVHGKTG